MLRLEGSGIGLCMYAHKGSSFYEILMSPKDHLNEDLNCSLQGMCKKNLVIRCKSTEEKWIIVDTLRLLDLNDEEFSVGVEIRTIAKKTGKMTLNVAWDDHWAIKTKILSGKRDLRKIIGELGKEGFRTRYQYRPGLYIVR